MACPGVEGVGGGDGRECLCGFIHVDGAREGLGPHGHVPSHSGLRWGQLPAWMSAGQYVWEGEKEVCAQRGLFEPPEGGEVKKKRFWRRENLFPNICAVKMISATWGSFYASNARNFGINSAPARTPAAQGPFGWSVWSRHPSPEGGGVLGTRPWWLALLACGGAYWPLALEPSAMTSRHPYYCGHLHCREHPHSWVGIQNATSAHDVLP